MAGTWQGLVNQPTFNTSTMILLTDGRVMVQEEATPHWHALTPDSHGDYLNGTWSSLADMSFWRRYYASGVLRDGRVIVIGGEQSGAGSDTNRGEIYDAVSDTWSQIPSPPGWPQVGDATCCIFPDGRLMIGALTSPQCIIYDPETNSWSPAASKAIRSNEETWILLRDNTVLTIQCFPPYQTEKYSISSNAWKNEGILPVEVVDPGMAEIGPGMLMYNGKVIFFGAANSKGFGKTVLYTPPPFPAGTGSWTAGPDIPHIGGKTMVCNDCPASLMPNGKVLVAAAQWVNGTWGSPIFFFEYDSFTNTMSQAPTPPNNGMQLFWSRFMLLPSGQVLFGPSSKNLQCYTPDGGPEEAWRPAISTIAPDCAGPSAGSYLLKGTQLNGLSQANIYGDDCYSATNYPLVRLQNPATGQVYFARTHNFSTMGVATGALVQSARFDASAIPYGSYDLCVIANGISSHCVSFCHRRHRCCGCEPCEVCCKETRSEDCCCEAPAGNQETTAMKNTLRGLQNTVQRLASQVKTEEPVREPKEATHAKGEDDKK
jgi:Kelch motif